MIPLQVKLKNFLSYGPELQTIHFDPHHLICLTGKNGHGKSALLDALTWALWGHARKTSGASKADNGLLRLGQSEMMVILDFTCAGSRYRIKREFLCGKIKSQQYLDFGVYDDHSDHLKPLTDKTIRATQAVINRVVGLDYETFINSAFIRQGQSNEFSTKTPKERKEILGNILGLDRFEKVRKLVLEEQRTTSTKIAQSKSVIERLETELAQQEKLNSDLEELKISGLEIEKRENQITKKMLELNEKKLQLQRKQHENSIIQVRHEHLIKQRQEVEQELTGKIAHWRSVNLKKASVEDKKKVEQQKKTLGVELTKLQQQQQISMQLKEKLFTLKTEEQKIIQEQENLIHKKLTTLTFGIEKLISEKNNIILQLNALYETEKKLAVQLKYTTDPKHIVASIEKHEQKFEKKEATLLRLRARYDHIRKEQEKSHQKISLIHQDDSTCPLCDQPLNQEHKAALNKKFEEQKALWLHQENRLKAVLQRAPAILEKDREIIENLKNIFEQQKKLSEVQDQIKEIEKAVATLSTKAEEITAERTKVENELQSWQNQHVELQVLHKDIDEVTRALDENIFDEKRYNKIIQELKSIDQKLEKQETLYDQLRQQAALKAHIHELCNNLRQLKKEIVPLKQTLASNTHLLLQSNEIRMEEQALSHETKQLSNEKTTYLEQKGRLEQLKTHLTQQKKECDTIKAQLISFEKKLENNALIAAAMSKDGIQALLIEEALPEIEDEANKLLSKLTDNTQHIFIESLKDLKSGATKETLDIKISDTIGIRPYELFSGGEAFRIDFALRIAISKLLARRAGASLQTLIIDEGFGSQDEEGLAHIMDALHRIQDDFAKIIVVSHLPAMQHQFPAQFYVSKGASGSNVQVIEQG